MLTSSACSFHELCSCRPALVPATRLYTEAATLCADFRCISKACSAAGVQKLHGLLWHRMPVSWCLHDVCASCSPCAIDCAQLYALSARVGASLVPLRL